MPNDLLYSLMAARDAFREGVRDQFGNSILNEVFEPMLTEVRGLIQASDEADSGLREVNALLNEARSITGNRT
jgi:hypothetical protein